MKYLCTHLRKWVRRRQASHHPIELDAKRSTGKNPGAGSKFMLTSIAPAAVIKVYQFDATTPAAAAAVPATPWLLCRRLSRGWVSVRLLCGCCVGGRLR